MTLLPQTRSFACGVLVALVCCGLLTAVRAQPTNQVVAACADGDGTLRLAEPSAACPPGQRRVVLKMPEIEEKADERDKSEDARGDELDRRLRELEERQQRGRLAPTKVVAPFEVVNDDGQRVFLIEDGQVSFYNRAGKRVVRIVANENGGYLQALSGTGTLSTSIGASGDDVGVLVQENEKLRVDLGRGSIGTYSLRFLKADGKLIAGIGQSPEGSGTALVFDANGRPRARMWVTPGRNAGIVDVLNDGNKAVASLTAGEGGDGRFELTNAAGEPMVVAGVTEGNVGVVRAGPFMFNSGAMFVGLPGSYIAGKAK